MDKIIEFCARVSVLFTQFRCIRAKPEGHEARYRADKQLVRRQGSHSWAV
jgi:hypothetical protein